jgi:hypothetical protein
VNIRYFTKEDLPTLNAWWKAKNVACGPDFSFDPRMLPSGVVVSGEDGTDLAVGFLYRTDSAIAWIEWVCGNPDAEPGARGTAVDKVIDTLLTEAKNQGYLVAFTASNLPALNSRLEKHGYAKMDGGMTHFIRRF